MFLQLHRLGGVGVKWREKYIVIFWVSNRRGSDACAWQSWNVEVVGGWLRDASPRADGHAGTRVIVFQRGEPGLKKLPGSLTLCHYLL